jgi:hypothetical protein
MATEVQGLVKEYNVQRLHAFEVELLEPQDQIEADSLVLNLISTGRQYGIWQMAKRLNMQARRPWTRIVYTSFWLRQAGEEL